MSDDGRGTAGPVAGAVRPPARSAYRARIDRVFDHTEGVRSLFLRCVGPRLPAFLPGMFVSITIPLAGGARVRPYTIASSPEDHDPFEIVFNRVPGGVGADWLFQRAIGDELSLTGPYGAFTLAQAPEAELVFIAENTAIAPIRPMIRRALAAPAGAVRRLKLLYGADQAAHLLYLDELESLASSDRRLELSIVVGGDDGGPLLARLGVEARRRWIDADLDRSRHFYICGVGPGVIELRDLFRGAGYERRAVHYEKW